MSRPRTTERPEKDFFVVIGDDIIWHVPAPENQRASYDGAREYIRKWSAKGEIPPLPEDAERGVPSTPPSDLVPFATAFQHRDFSNFTTTMVNAMIRMRTNTARPDDKDILIKMYDIMKADEEVKDNGRSNPESGETTRKEQAKASSRK